jgi:Uma2 family endonuclease
MSTASKAIRLNLGSAGLRLTPEEFDSVKQVDERFAYELINGVVVVSRIPSNAEADPNGELEYLLRHYKKTHPLGASLDKTLGERYVYLPQSRRRADRLIWAGLGRIPNTETDLPTIAVEFVSRSRRDHLRDYQEKRTEYLAVGIQEYWIIDRFRRLMTVHKATAQGILEILIEEQETYRTDFLPGFELPLSALLIVADDWRKGP